MTTFIRFLCVNLLLSFVAPLLAEPVLLPFNAVELYQYQTRTQATWIIEVDQRPLEIVSQFDLKGNMKFLLEDQKMKKMQFQLREAVLSLDGQSISLVEPRHSLEMNELKIFENQWVLFDLLDAPPYIQLDQKAQEIYKDLKLVKEPILTGIFGEDLHLLLEILRHPLLVGEGFEVIVPKREQRQYEMIQTVVVKEVTPDFVTLEVTTVSDRQKISGEEGDSAVLYYQAEAVWVLDRLNALNFQIVENGIFTQTMRTDGVESSQRQLIRRDVRLVGEGQRDDN